MLATSALSALSGPAPAKAEPAPGAAGGDAKAAEQLQVKNKVSEQKAEIKKVEDKEIALKEDIKVLTAEKDKIAPAKEEGGAATQPAATAGQTAQIAEYDKRIKAKADELKTQEAARVKLEEAVNSLQASLGALEKGVAKLSDEQQQQAASLRDMQMRMLDKVEAYENERRNQSAELVKVNALLKGKRQEDDSIELAIRSLNLSLSGLKRMKEIVEEIAFFFNPSPTSWTRSRWRRQISLTVSMRSPTWRSSARTGSRNSSGPSTSSSSNRRRSGAQPRS
jgi:hypothetical protein